MNPAEMLLMTTGGDGEIFISNGSEVDFEFDDLTGWTGNDQTNGVSTQEIFDTRSTFKLLGGTIYNGINRAARYKILAHPGGDRIVLSLIMYHDSLGSSSASGEGVFNFLYQLTSSSDYYFIARLWSDKITIRNWSGVDVTMGVVTPTIGGWSTFTVDITGLSSPATAICDFYYNNVLIAPGAQCSRTGALGSAGYTEVQQIARENSPFVSRTSYMDRLLIGDGLA